MGIVALGTGVIFGTQYLQYRFSDEYKIAKEIEILKKQYAEDPYGGDTPEETLRLFVDALKKGDTDLAAKYFIMEKQEEWRKNLNISKEKNNVSTLIKIVERANYGKEIYKNHYLFSIVNDNNEEEFSIKLVRNPNNKWKIQNL